MAATVMDGTAVAARVRAEVADGAAAFLARHGRAPGLATVLVGDDPASAIYVRSKRRLCEEVGIASFDRDLPADAEQATLLRAIEALAADDAVDGILVQVPLPPQIDEATAIAAIPVEKDVDGFHQLSMGALAMGRPGLRSCTPHGVMRLLREYEVPLRGARATIVGRSHTVGLPMSLMLLEADATITVAHHASRDLPGLTRTADILVSATGVAGLITADMVKPGAAVIDVGTIRTDEGLRGDVDYDAVAQVAGHISPVPGGVGPMTIATLLANTLAAAQARTAPHD